MATNLENFLDEASAAYYDGNPIITDAQFDTLAEKSNYKKVGAKQGAGTSAHLFRMYSLQKYYENEDKIKPLGGDLSMSPKLDGAAISLLYVNKDLVRVLTRGDGTVGRDITELVRNAKFCLVPKTITLPGVIQVTGEVVATINIENPRNYASGALNLKSQEEFDSRVLSFYAYGIYPYQTPTYDDDLAVLKLSGFSTVKEPDLDKVYPCDGIVFRLNNNSAFDSYGFTDLYPKGAYAVKERGEEVETVILDVEWQVGKTGKVTPVAILEPVYIGDALISRATLNNPKFIETLGIEIGDTVAVMRAGEIIPCITHRVE